MTVEYDTHLQQGVPWWVVRVGPPRRQRLQTLCASRELRQNLCLLES